MILVFRAMGIFGFRLNKIGQNVVHKLGQFVYNILGASWNSPGASGRPFGRVRELSWCLEGGLWASPGILLVPRGEPLCQL